MGEFIIVIPAKAGIHGGDPVTFLRNRIALVDSGFRRNDGEA
jgi:hypothetical protein